MRRILFYTLLAVTLAACQKNQNATAFSSTTFPVCSYARNVLTRTNDYKDILA